jgi:hypothetical protein
MIKAVEKLAGNINIIVMPTGIHNSFNELENVTFIFSICKVECSECLFGNARKRTHFNVPTS